MGGTGYEIGHSDNTAVLKYPTEGEMLWVRHYDGPTAGSGTVSSLVYDGEGGVYAAGYRCRPLSGVTLTRSGPARHGQPLPVGDTAAEEPARRGADPAVERVHRVAGFV